MGKDFNFHTYINKNGNPMVRKCGNCTFWKEISETKIEYNIKIQSSGYCKKTKLLFSLTLENSRNFISRKCDLCINHQFVNEQELESEAQKVEMKKIIESAE